MATYYSQALMMNFSGEPMHPTSLPLLPSPIQQRESANDQDLETLVSKSILMVNGMDEVFSNSTLCGEGPQDLSWSVSLETPEEISSPPAALSSPVAALTPPPSQNSGVAWAAANRPITISPSHDSILVTSGEPQNLPAWSAVNVPESSPASIVVTPPPEGPPPPYPYPPTWYSLPQASSSMPSAIPTSDMSSNLTNYFYNDYSPLSSPGSTESNSIAAMQDTYHLQSPMAMPISTYPPSLCTSYYTEATSMLHTMMNEPPVVSTCAIVTPTSEDGFGPKEVKMPQRKGGIQLWQFLNYLLNNPEKKHRDLIEWTANKHDKEFRMLEPESIAIWWGHHKNKPGMTYDKFSRSLRYYYDKGILKKIQGERFVYRFLIDPEVMYEHIGTADCRPKVKPMPKAAKAAMTKFHKTSHLEFKTQAVRVTQEAETLERSLAADVTTVHTSLQSSTPNTPPWNAHQSSTSNSLIIPPAKQYSASSENLAQQSSEVITPLPIKRCKSLENTRNSYSQVDQQTSLPFIPSSFPLISNNGYQRYLSAELQVNNITQTHESLQAPFSASGYDMFYISS